MPHEDQRAAESDTYENSVQRHVHEWPAEWLMTIQPVREERCRKYIGELNQLDDPPTDVIEHFADRIRELENR